MIEKIEISTFRFQHKVGWNFLQETLAHNHIILFWSLTAFGLGGQVKIYDVRIRIFSLIKEIKVLTLEIEQTGHPVSLVGVIKRRDRLWHYKLAVPPKVLKIVWETV